MARRKSPPETLRARFYLSERLRAVRTQLYGERGGPELARRLGVPIRTWYNYESGVTVPSEIMLRFIELTAVEPTWMLHGVGPRFRMITGPLGPMGSVESLLRSALEHLDEEHGVEDSSSAGPAGGDRDRRSATRTGASSIQKDTKEAAIPGPPWDEQVPQHWRYVRMEGDAMAPIVADGAFVAHAVEEEDLTELDGAMVVAWLQGGPTVRWFELSGDLALLRAEDREYVPPFTLFDLGRPPGDRSIRRVLWVGTVHGPEPRDWGDRAPEAKTTG